MCQMNVRRVRSAKESQRRFVTEPPELNLIKRDFRVAPVRVEFLSVDGPRYRWWSPTRVETSAESPCSGFCVLGRLGNPGSES